MNEYLRRGLVLGALIATVTGFCVYHKGAQAADQKPLNLELKSPPWEKPKPGSYNIQVQWTIDTEPEKKKNAFYGWAVTFGCRSRHDMDNKPNHYKENNPCLGGTKFFEPVWGITPFLSYRYIPRNSRDGEMKAYGPGAETCPLPGQYVDVCFGATRAWIKYEDAWIGKTAKGKATVPHLAFKHGPTAIQVESLGRRDYSVAIRVSFN